MELLALFERLAALRVFGAAPYGWRPAAALLVLALQFIPSGSPHALDRGADGHFEKRVSSHFVLYQDVDIDRTSGLRGSRRFEQEVLRALESAYREADELLGLRPSRPITVVVYDSQIFESRFSGLFRFPAAGFYGGRIHIRGDDVVSSQLVRVLRHEFVHAAFDAEAPSVSLPGWLNEGVAEFFEISSVGHERLSNRQRRWLHGALGRGQLFSLPELSAPSFGSLEAPEARLAYVQSTAFIEFIVRSHGERRLREWLGDILRKGNLERATRRNFKRGLSELEEDFRRQLAVTFG